MSADISQKLAAAAEAQARAQAIIDRATASNGAAQANTDRATNLRADLQAVGAELKRQQQAPAGRVNAAAVAALEARQKDMRAEVARLQAVADASTARWKVERRQLDRIETFLAGVPASAIRPAPPVKIPKNATIETVRRDLAELAHEVERVHLARVPKAVLAERIEQAVDRLAERGKPRVDPRVRDGDPSRIAAGLTGDAGLHLLCWLLRDVLVERLVELLPDDDAGTLDDESRERRLAELERQRLALERVEVVLIEQAEREGRRVAHRADISIAALLGVEVVEGRR